MTNCTVASPSIPVALSANPVATNEASSQQAQPKINEITTHVKRLNDTHYKECVEQRGLDPEWIRVNCESFNKKQASERLGYAAQSEGIWLEGANGFGQYRPNKAWKSKEEKASKKQAPKYRCATEEEIDAMLPKHPTNPQYWEDLVELAKLCWVIDGKACLVITEGMFKAIMGCQHGIPTIALAGVWQGFTKKDWAGRKHLVETLYRLAGTGKFGFIIIFDADANTNKNIVAATRELAHGLSKAKVPVYIGTGLWNESEGKGMDDFIKKCGIDRFKREVMGKVVDLRTWEKQFTSTSEKTNKKIKDRDYAVLLADKYRSKLAWHVPAKAWYQYEAEKPGVWSEVPEEQILSFVIDETIKDGLNVGGSFISSVIRLLKGRLNVNHWEVKNGVICLEDCVVNIKTLESFPHDPGYRMVSSLPFKWSDRGIGCDVILDWMLSACNGHWEWVEVIRAAMNATLTSRGHDFQRYMELIGAGGSGKGTVIRLVKALLGKDNYAVTDLKQLENNRFETAMFYGKKAIFISDSEQFSGDVSTLKKITGGDPLRHEKKGVQQTGSFDFYGVVWIAANSPIQSKEYTNALARRRLSMPFNNVVPPSERRELMPEFEPYLPGLLYWVLSMDSEAVRQNFLNTSATVPSLRAYAAEVLMQTNPVAAWADECLISRPDLFTSVGKKDSREDTHLYPNYYQWALSMGINPMGQQNFSRYLVQVLNTQALLPDCKKVKKECGQVITGVVIRLPGHAAEPGLITGQLINSDNLDDNSLTTSCKPDDNSLTTEKISETLTQTIKETSKEKVADNLNPENQNNSFPLTTTTNKMQIKSEELQNPGDSCQEPMVKDSETSDSNSLSDYSGCQSVVSKSEECCHSSCQELSAQVKTSDIITAKLLPTDAAAREAKVTKVEETGVWAATGTCEYFVKWENIQAVNSQLTQKWWEQKKEA